MSERPTPAFSLHLRRLFLGLVGALAMFAALAVTATTTASAATYSYDLASNTRVDVPGINAAAAKTAVLGVLRDGSALSPAQARGAPTTPVAPVVATDTVRTGAGPIVDEAFQFGGAGRSGAGVKNFVGPKNAVVKGASQGRVFVTDAEGRVILDITADRVKPVVPGQGFVAGDGRKLVPTAEQLDWISELWG